MPKYRIITYGCQTNEADSERIAASLEKKGYKAAKNPKKADLIVVNMCSVRQTAVDKIFGIPMKLKGVKAKKILTGCILRKDLPKFRKIFDEIKIMPQRNCPSALIPISYGCNNFCTYCVVPYTRGRLACRKPQEIIKDVKRAVRSGLKEIWLLGQNINDYSPISFAKLLKRVNAVPGDFKIRFISPNPKNFSEELIDAMSECKKVAKYLNLPVQSGDNSILKRMNRNYTIKQYKNLVKRIRKKMPNINLSTDVIVGFPGETEKQFKNTAKLFKEINFDIAYVSKYSPRPGTAAWKLKDGVSLKEKQRRAKILMKLVKHPSI